MACGSEESGNRLLPEQKRMFCLGHSPEIHRFQSYSQRCSHNRRIAQLNVTQIQFLPTFYWYDAGPIDPPADFNDSCQGSDLSGAVFCESVFDALSKDGIWSVVQRRRTGGWGGWHEGNHT